MFLRQLLLGLRLLSFHNNVFTKFSAPIYKFSQADYRMIRLSPECINKWDLVTSVELFQSLSCWYKYSSLWVFLWNQPTLLLTIHAVSSTTTSHIDFSLKMMDSSSHDSLSAGSRSPPMLFLFLFNSLQKCLRATPDCHRPHDRSPPSSTCPAWPVKSRRSRATLELSQLLEQMSLRSSSVRTARRHRERELRVQNYSWLCVFSLWILGFIYLFFTFVQFLQYGVSRFMPGELHKDTCWDARLQVSRRGIWRIQLHFKWIKIIKLIISINLFLF